MCPLGAVTGGQEVRGARHFVPQNLMLDLTLPKRSSWRLGHRASALSAGAIADASPARSTHRYACGRVRQKRYARTFLI